MGAKADHVEVAEALLCSARDGGYPESESVLVADLHSSSLGPIIKEVIVARHKVEKEICGISRDSSSDVDGWIAQARQLQRDITESRGIARKVVEEHEKGRALAAAKQDAKAKVDLLLQEERFSTQVSTALAELNDYKQRLDDVQSKLGDANLLESTTELQDLRALISQLSNSHAQRILQDRLEELRVIAHTRLEGHIDRLFCFGRDGRRTWLQVNSMLYDVADNSPIDADSTMEACRKLDAADMTVKTLSQKISRYLCQPLLSPGKGLLNHIGGRRLDISSDPNDKNAHDVLRSMSTLVEFLNANLPVSVRQSVSTILAPSLISKLVEEWLTPCVPLQLADVLALQTLQEEVTKLAELWKAMNWPQYEDLEGWIDRAPRIWLAKRRVASLDAVRKVLATDRGATRNVERIERQTVSVGGDALAKSEVVEDWEADWGEDNSSSQSPRGGDEDPGTQVSVVDAEVRERERDDASNGAKEGADEEADDWAWDDESPDKTRQGRLPRQASSSQQKAIDSVNGKAGAEQELVLKETYTVTDIPDSILEIITKDIHDAEVVKGSDFLILHDVAPSTGLLTLPIFVLAMFRATAATYYVSSLSSSNMHLYNDCIYMAEKLRGWTTPPELASIRTECDALEKYAKGAYSREMEVQRIILADLLDGAQGFTSCTQFPFSTECETAISSVFDRIKAVHQEWTPVLSHSALLQSVGSLVSTVIDKIVKDIEDMEDISEPESRRLALFCGQISKLGDLFLPPGGATAQLQDGVEVVPLTAVYVSNWLRFQYLANILESSLVDIKYLWTEGELSLEFSAEEVIDLIRALFAESSHRRTAIQEIRTK